jgi:hypothetical protein
VTAPARPVLDWRVAIAGGAVAALGLAGFALARDSQEAPTPDPIDLRATVLPEPVTVPEAEDTDDEPSGLPAAPASTLPPPPATVGQVAPSPAPAPAPPDDTDDSPDVDSVDSVD